MKNLILYSILLSFIAFSCSSNQECALIECMPGYECVEGECIGFCTPNPCKNGGICLNDECGCPGMYDGQFCDSTIAQKFLGKFKLYQSSCFPDSNTIVIREMAQLDQISINGLAYEEDQAVIGRISLTDKKTFNVARQSLTVDGTPFDRVEAQGRIDANGKLIITYDLFNSQGNERRTCTEYYVVVS